MAEPGPGAHPMSFAGFPEEALLFYEGLEADNSRTYWKDHRPVYDRCVKTPMEALLAHLEPEFGPGRMFRPYRDVRFTRNKPVYKTEAGAVVRDPTATTAYYVEISAAGLSVAAGIYSTAADQVRRYRQAVDVDHSGERLRSVVDELHAAGYQIKGHRLRTRPRGYPTDHRRAGLLRHRTLYASRAFPPDERLHTSACAHWVEEAWREMSPLSDWLIAHVGPAAPPA